MLGSGGSVILLSSLAYHRLRQEDRGERADRFPDNWEYRARRVVTSWMLQCGGKYPLEIGDLYYVRLDEAREMAKRMRPGDWRAIIEAYIANDNCSPYAYSGSEEEDMFRTLGLSETEYLIARNKVHLKDFARDAYYADTRWRLRHRIHHLEAILKRVYAFAKREGLKVRKAKPIAEPGAASLRAA